MLELVDDDPILQSPVEQAEQGAQATVPQGEQVDAHGLQPLGAHGYDGR